MIPEEMMKMTVGESIKAERKKVGLTQKKLAERIGVSTSLIGQWENGLRLPKRETLLKIASALKCAPFTEFTGAHRLMSKDEYDKLIAVPIEKLSFTRGDEHLFGIVDFDLRFYRILVCEFMKLNAGGQQIAIQRVQELTEIPRYTLQDEQKETPDDEQTKTPV